jgi:regulator of protease activity HflC (stomatin/prohibitin superfamily)
MNTQKMKFACAALIAASFLALSGCVYDEVREIKPNETAFLIKLTGDTKAGQKSFMSEEFLQDNKVATKRIVIPVEKLEGQYRPTMSLIVVDRSPVTREWTSAKTTGTSASNQAISVESIESIDFTIGVTLTASILEKDTAKFLYNYAGKQLADIADSNIRGFVQSALSTEFGSRSLKDSRAQKKEIFAKVLTDVRASFMGKGITIDNLGYTEGMTYSDKKIQESINQIFQAEMEVKTAEQQKLAQEQRNIQKIETAKAERQAAEEFAKAQSASVAKLQMAIEQTKADAVLEFAKRVSGNLPNIIASGSPLLSGIGLDVSREALKK